MSARSVRTFYMAVLFALMTLLSGCKQEDTGPGMTVTWATLDEERKIWLETIKLPSGNVQNHSVSIIKDSAKVEGFSPDNRVIPEWVELGWIEPIYYRDKTKAPSIEARVAATDQLPIKSQRVEVGSTIPETVIEQVLEANRNRQANRLSEKYIWGYFTWKDGKVFFGWELRQVHGNGADTHSTVLVSGGTRFRD